MRNLKITTLPTAKEAWIDRDMIMLHACFQLLVDFVEKEDGLNHWSYESYKEPMDELRCLYDWWKENKNTISIDDEVADENLIRLVKLKGYLWT